MNAIPEDHEVVATMSIIAPEPVPVEPFRSVAEAGPWATAEIAATIACERGGCEPRVIVDQIPIGG